MVLIELIKAMEKGQTCFYSTRLKKTVGIHNLYINSVGQWRISIKAGGHIPIRELLKEKPKSAYEQLPSYNCPGYLNLLCEWIQEWQPELLKLHKGDS